jgi:hypothetical protein
MSVKYSRLPVAGAALLGGAVFGAVIGGTSSAVTNVRKVKQGEMEREEAVRAVAKEAAFTGLAAGTATGVVGALGLGGVLALVGVAAVATGARYALDRTFERKTDAKEPCPASAAPVKVADKAADGAVSSGKAAKSAARSAKAAPKAKTKAASKTAPKASESTPKNETANEVK